MNTEYWVPKGRVEGFEVEVERLNRRAKRFGLPVLEVEVTEETDRVVIGEGPVTLESAPEHTLVYGTLVKVLVGGELPKLNGWEFVARIDHDAGGNLLYTHHGAPDVPEEYWKVGRTCDHCRTNRRRKDTYLLHHVENGEWKHVGSSCMKDFLGHKLTAGWFAVYGDLADLDVTFKEYLGGGCEPEYTLKTVLAYTSAYCKEYGWKSRTKARDERSCATADGVFSELTDSKSMGSVNSLNYEETKPDASDFEEAGAAIEWAKGLETNGSNYLTNVKVLAGRGFLTWKAFGIGCSILAAWKRETEVAREKAEERESNYVGEVKKREEFTLTLESLTSIEGLYGMTLLHNFKDADGNRVKWFASGSVGLGLEEGETVKVKATVKSHEEYKGRKETLVNRAVLVEGGE